MTKQARNARLSEDEQRRLIARVSRANEAAERYLRAKRELEAVIDDIRPALRGAISRLEGRA